MKVRKPAASVLLLMLAGCAGTPPAVNQCGLAEPLPSELRDARAIMVGEVHGTVEMPKFVGDLACSLLKHGRRVTVALEIPHDLMPDLQVYLDSDGGQEAVARLIAVAHWNREMKYQDGRASRAMLKLIDDVRRWRAAGERVDIAAFDLAVTRPHDREQMQQMIAQRDRRMAERAGSIWDPEATLILLAGNFHAVKYPDEAAMPGRDRMAALMNPQPEVSILLQHRGGMFWGCTREGCALREASPDYKDGELDGRIVFNRRLGYDAVGYVGRLSASPPARQP